MYCIFVFCVNILVFFLFFFFQAEDGIRDRNVTGVQTCALPISEARTNHVLIKNYSVVGVHWGLYNVMNPQIVHDTHDELMRLFEAGQIDPLISQSVALEDVPAALARLGTRGTYGKLVCELA